MYNKFISQLNHKEKFLKLTKNSALDKQFTKQ